MGETAAVVAPRSAEVPMVQLTREKADEQVPEVYEPTLVKLTVAGVLRGGRLPELADEVRRRDGSVLFVMHSLGVAERVAEILAEYKVEARVALSGE